MTRQEVFEEINIIQDEYIDELIGMINSPEYETLKTISITSATGTGKTKMMSKLINRFPYVYFIVTTLSKGQLHIQVRNSLKEDCLYHNFKVYGSADYKINSVLEAEDIIGEIPANTKCIWIRDEGHIRTNRFEELLINKCYKIINFSATNPHSDITCNFSQTMMLRTVTQTNGTPKDAIEKLIEVKRVHSNIKNYNPCAIFRCIGGDKDLYEEIVTLCKKHNLKHIDITDETFDMSELCLDDNEYDVIINKYKLVEGIDIKRAHVLYMDSQPRNATTTIQAVGRCRRNALLYRDDIDIMAPENRELLEQTRRCYVYFYVKDMKIDTDEYGELQYAFCDHISCESLKTGMPIQVINGQLPNGLYVLELANQTGKFNVTKDVSTGYNVVEPATEFYDTEIIHIDRNYVYTRNNKIHVNDISKLSRQTTRYDYVTGDYIATTPYYILKNEVKRDEACDVSKDILRYYRKKMKIYTKDAILSKIQQYSIDYIMSNNMEYNLSEMKQFVDEYIDTNKEKKGLIEFCQFLSSIEMHEVEVGGFVYKLSEVCTMNELIVIAYHCVKKKIDLYENDEIFADITYALEQRRKIYSKRLFVSEIKYALFFDMKGVDDYQTWSELKNCVHTFIEENCDDEKYNNFCSILVNLRNKEGDDVFRTLNNISLDNNDITLIQYLCINEKKNGLTDEAIIEKINNFIEAQYRLNLKRDMIELERLVYLLFEQRVRIIYDLNIDELTVKVEYPNTPSICKQDIDNFYDAIDTKIENCINSDNSSYIGLRRVNEKKVFACSLDVVDDVNDALENTEKKLEGNVIPWVDYSYSILFEGLNETEEYLIRNKYLDTCYMINEDEIRNFRIQIPYDIIINDKESSIIGVDLMKQRKRDCGDIIWTESTTVTSKVGNYNKFNTFLSNRYSNELEQAKAQYFSGSNEFKLDKKCNSMIGYCVEYYSKYLVYGEEYLEKQLQQAKEEMNEKTITNAVVVRACMIKYREMMILCYGTGVSKVIKSIGAKTLQNKEYQYFINLIGKLGQRTANYVKKELYNNEEAKNDIDPNLSIRHISGLADYITTDTILDVKVRNNINENSVRQVLAYHYLSTKRSDLQIKKVIVYDATSNRAVVINIDKCNIKLV